jgi:hypothetical protein
LIKSEAPVQVKLGVSGSATIGFRVGYDRVMRASLVTLAAVAVAFAAMERVLHISAAARSSLPSVAVVTLPGGAIQPQAVVDAKDVLHVVFFRGTPAGGDLYYVTMGSDGHELTQPVRVNSIDGSALATGSIRGAQVSLGRNGFIHVAWHGAKPLAGGAAENVPMWYTRSKDGIRFEPQRAVSGSSKNLDGGSVASDRAGHVSVVWHAMGAEPGEGHRTVYIANSSDDGATFSAEVPATPAPVGACGCCGMRALFDRDGTLHVLYRAATNGTNRDTTWLMIRGASPLTPVRVHPWELQSCPMSTFALTESEDGVVAAWETAQQIYSATLHAKSGTVGPIVAVPGSGGRKHPSVSVNSAGQTLLAWTEGTAWNRGGTAAWRLTDRDGKQLASSEDAGPVPVWGLVSAVTLRDGSFVLLR